MANINQSEGYLICAGEEAYLNMPCSLHRTTTIKVTCDERCTYLHIVKIGRVKSNTACGYFIAKEFCYNYMFRPFSRPSSGCPHILFEVTI